MAKEHKPKPWRATPLVRSTALSRVAGCNIYLKLENLQPSGSFKSRGVGNFILQRLRDASDDKPTHFYSSSGGNAGLACVHAAVAVNCAATIIVPMPTSAYLISKMRIAGAEDVVQIGESWAEADAYLKETVLPAARARGENAVYVPPFDHPDIWTGNATMVPEILDALERESSMHPAAHDTRVPDAIVCSIGGGGLFNGLIEGLDKYQLTDKIPILAIETKGADSFNQALQRKELITLPKITSIATTLGARQVAARTFENGQRSTVQSVVLSDADAVFGCLQLADEDRMLVEPACGVCITMCYGGRLKKALPNLTSDSNVVIVVCGGSGVSMEMLETWKQKYL